MASLDDVMSALKSLHRDVRKIRQFIEDPTGDKAKNRAENNGFKKPIDVDDKLRAFLKLKKGDTISRSEVTRAINVYAEENKLKAGQVINLDATLKDLLNPPEGEVVTFLKLQKFLAPHYLKADAPVVAVPPPKTEDVVPPKKPRVAKK